MCVCVRRACQVASARALDHVICLSVCLSIYLSCHFRFSAPPPPPPPPPPHPTQCIKLAEKISSRTRVPTDERPTDHTVGQGVSESKSGSGANGAGGSDPFKNTLIVIDDDGEAAAGGGADAESQDTGGGAGAARAGGDKLGEPGSVLQEGSAAGKGMGVVAVACSEADYDRIFADETPVTCSSLTRAVQTAVMTCLV